MPNHPIVIAGGGAAGYFAAITAAETATRPVILIERTSKPLAKVLISGGGRCNVTHACFDPKELVKHYPRGNRELRGPFHRWQPRDTVKWFESRGVFLKTEADGRMFPETDSSETIAQCLKDAAQKAGVEIRLKTKLSKVETLTNTGDARFKLTLDEDTPIDAYALLIATGGGSRNAGHTIAAALGHTIEPPVPSLFTFNIEDPRLKDLQGISVPNTTVSVNKKLTAKGPLLITHWGLSGPGILRLSAWGARTLHECHYRFDIRINWLGTRNQQDVASELQNMRNGHGKKRIATHPQYSIPSRLWERLCHYAMLPADATWTQAPKKKLDALARELCDGQYRVTDKSTNKDEFVTCGGVRLSEIEFKTMQSKLVPGLYFAGEVLDIDGITGGFNFQAAWTGGFLAGTAMATPPTP